MIPPLQKEPRNKMPSRRAPKCKIPCIRAETFDVDDHENWLAHLEEEGFVVLHAELALEMFKHEFCTVSPRFTHIIKALTMLEVDSRFKSHLENLAKSHITCRGCREDQPNQLAHTGEGGCLCGDFDAEFY
jgi:hypothetical protein